MQRLCACSCAVMLEEYLVVRHAVVVLVSLGPVGSCDETIVVQKCDALDVAVDHLAMWIATAQHLLSQA